MEGREAWRRLFFCFFLEGGLGFPLLCLRFGVVWFGLLCSTKLDLDADRDFEPRWVRKVYEDVCWRGDGGWWMRRRGR